MASPICHMEIEYARKIGKRIIPVLHLDYDRDAAIARITERLANPGQDATRELWGIRQPRDIVDANESELKHINLFFFGPQDDFRARFAELLAIIRTDYQHKEQHTMLELRAQEWNRRGRDVSFLLLDNELADAQTWLQTGADKSPPPTSLHMEYIQASEKRTRDLRNVRRTSYITLTIAVLATVFVAFAIVSGWQVLKLVDYAREGEDQANTQAAIIRQQAHDEQAIAQSFADAMLILNDSPDESLAQMDALVAQYPERPVAWVYRGLVYRNLGDYARAIADYDAAIRLDPEYALAYSNRGAAYHALGDHEAARSDWAMAESLGYALPQAIQDLRGE